MSARNALAITTPLPVRLTDNAVSFAKSLCPTLKGLLPDWRKLFGLGLQADS